MDLSAKRQSELDDSSDNCTLRSFKSRSNTSYEKMIIDEQSGQMISIKSKFGSDYRRMGVTCGGRHKYPTYQEFLHLIEDLHKLTEEQKKCVNLMYSTADGTNLPISNDDNLRKVLSEERKILQVIVQNRAESLEERFGYGVSEDVMLRKKKKVTISNPQDFRRVSSIIDTDILPSELIRVRLCKFYANKPLGFFIRDGLSERMSPWGPMATPAIFISRLLENGVAASTNLLHVNDEILEVNGIDVCGKTLDQVTDIMIANAANLVLTVRPAPPIPLSNRFKYAPPPYSSPSQFSPASMRENIPYHMNPPYPDPRHQYQNDYAIPSPGPFSPREMSRFTDKFNRASLNSASTSSATSSQKERTSTGSSHSGSGVKRAILRNSRPFSVHYGGDPEYTAPYRSVPIQAHRYSTLYDQY